MCECRKYGLPLLGDGKFLEYEDHVKSYVEFFTCEPNRKNTFPNTAICSNCKHVLLESNQEGDDHYLGGTVVYRVPLYKGYFVVCPNCFDLHEEIVMNHMNEISDDSSSI